MDKLRLELVYEWEPFTVNGQHLTFAQLRERQLFSNECSHWGAAIYKWQGLVTKGTRFGKVGILIGETDDLRQCVQQYASARGASRDALARSEFLSAGDIRLSIFRLHNATLNVEDSQCVQDSQEVLDGLQPVLQASLVHNNAKRRTLYQQLLQLGKAMQNRSYIWIVNLEF